MDLSIGLITLNAKFIHSSLSLRYLRNAARDAGFQNVWILEFIINQPVWKIAAEIQRQQPDVVGISVYIWNRIKSFQLIELLQKQNPSLSIVIGGPEVSFEPSPPSQYVVISGEGENKWVEFINYRKRSETPPVEVLHRWKTYGTDLPELNPPYLEEDYPDLKNRIAYLETSRGCPYLCSFCLSALDKTVRYFDDDRVRGQIERLVKGGVKIIKFVDRTFNLQPQRMKSLMQWLTRFKGTSFHFEVVGDLLTADMMDFLKTVPAGMFQFEIGVQTANEAVQSAIERKQNNRRLFDAIEHLVRQNRVQIHCDLIFGLPGENFDQVLNSFTTVFQLKPHELQLGFLKFLPGAPIRELIEAHQYQFQSFPPYEVISHKDLSSDQTLYLKKFTEVFDLFYNSQRFKFSIDRLLNRWTPVKIFDHILQYLENHGLFQKAHSLDSQYQVFLNAFSLEGDALAMDLLRLDYVYHQRVFRLPHFLLKGLTIDRRFKTWRGDGKSPLFPFMHEIEFNGPCVTLNPVSDPMYYGFIHPEEKNGYLAQPDVVRASETSQPAG